MKVYLELSQTMMELFLEKSSIIYAWMGSKYTFGYTKKPGKWSFLPPLVYKIMQFTLLNTHKETEIYC